MVNYHGTRFKLTTIDNPYSPFSDWPRWYAMDLALGYDTCGLLSRMCAATDTQQDEAEVWAIRDIIANNYSGKHVSVVPSDYDPFLKSDVKV